MYVIIKIILFIMFLERTWEKIRYSQGFHIAYFTLMLSIEKWKHVKRHNNRHKRTASGSRGWMDD